MTEEHVLRPLFDWRSAVASTVGPESPITRHVLLTISLHMSPKGDSCFPSVRLLAEETGLARTTVMKHLEIAADTGWIQKEERPHRNGQGWRRMEYMATTPIGLEERMKTAIEKGGPPDGPPSERGPSGDEGGPPDSEKVVHQADLSSSVNSSKRFTPEEKGQGQNRPAGPACAHCDGPLTGGHTRLRIGNVCNPCYADYLAGKWKLEAAA